MTNVTISVDEKTLEASRKIARMHGMSFNAFVRDLLKKAVGADHAPSLEETFALADRLGSKSDGKKWTRDELYDRKVLR